MNKSINLCEILSPRMLKSYSVEEILQEAIEDEPERIYLGSNFCSQFFLHTSSHWQPVFDYARKNHIPITLTLPIFSQKDLQTAKMRIGELMTEATIDEVTVNDLGNLAYLDQNYDIVINLGRLFFKDARDVRVPGYFHSETTPLWFSQLEMFDRIGGIELDSVTDKINLTKDLDTLTVSVHYPYTYMTTGNICKFASINKPLEYKFRPNDYCSLECTRIHEFYVENFDPERDEESEIFRFGREVYFLNDSAQFIGDRKPDRMIYFPLKELSLFGEE